MEREGLTEGRSDGGRGRDRERESGQGREGMKGGMESEFIISIFSS